MKMRGPLPAALLILALGCGQDKTEPEAVPSDNSENAAKGRSGTGISSWRLHRGSPSLNGSVNTTFPRRWQTDWTRTGPASPVTGLAVADGSLYIAHANGTVLRLGEDGQKVHWQQDLEAEFDAPITIARGYLLAGSLQGRMMALRREDGTLAWEYQTDDAIRGGATLARTGTDTAVVVFGSYDTYLYALNPDNGDLVWRHPTKNYVNGTPAVLERSVIASGCDGRVRRLQAATGREVFSTAASSYVPGAPAVQDNLALVAGHDGTIAAVFVDDGTLAWSVPSDDNRQAFVLSPGTSKDSVFVSSQSGQVFSRALDDGRLRWQTTLPSPATTAPLIGRETLLFGTEGGTLEQRELSSGNPVSSTLIGSAISCDPAVTPSGLLLGTEQGLVIHLKGLNTESQK